MISALTTLAAPAATWATTSPATAAATPSVLDQGPASSEQLALYARIASVNTCLATTSGQDFEQAAGVAAETIAQLLLGIHHGLLQSSGSAPLSLEELRTGSLNAAVIGATEICPEQVPSALADKLRQALTDQGSASSG